MKIILVDIPAGVVYQTDIARYMENILSDYRKEITQKELFDKFSLRKPAHRTYTLGLLSIATILKEHSYDIEYVLSDDYSSDEELVKDIFNKNIDVLLFSCKTTTLTRCLEMAQKAKSNNHKIINIFGGPHPTFLPTETLKNEFVDFVVIGEGELTILDLMNNLSFKNSGIEIDDIKGIARKGAQQNVVINPKRPMVDDLEAIPAINYDLLPHPIHDFYTYLETRRGCSHRCSYCATPNLWKNKRRTLEAKTAYSRIEKLASKLPSGSLIHLINPSFGVSEEDDKLCQLLIERPLGVKFSCDLCANVVNPEKIRLMYDAGFVMFSIGMESGSDTVLKKNKRLPFKYVSNACEVIKNVTDAFIKGYWIVGLPGETPETLKESNDKIMNLMKRGLMDFSCEHLFVPYPGSDIFINPDSYDYTIHHKNWEFYDSRSFPLPASSKKFSMMSAYLGYLEVLKSQIEYYGVPDDMYQKNITNKKVDFLVHKKQLV